MFIGSRRNDILKIHPGRSSRFLHKRKETVNIPRLKRFNLLRDTVIVPVKMNASQHGSVPVFPAKLRKRAEKVFFVHFAKHLFAKMARNLLLFHRNGRILAGQVCMAGPAVDNAQLQSGFLEIHIQLFDNRILRIPEIDGNQVSDRGCHLVHQPGRLAKVIILRILSDLGDLYRVRLILKEKVVDDRADQHLKGSRGAQAGSGEYRRRNDRTEPPDLAAHGYKLCRDAADQGCCRVKLGLSDRHVLQINLAHGIPFRKNLDPVVLRKGNGSDGIQIHGSGKYAPVLMIRVVSTDLRPSRSGKQADLILLTEGLLVKLQKRSVARRVRPCLFRIQRTDLLHEFLSSYSFLPFTQFHNRSLRQHSEKMVF